MAGARLRRSTATLPCVLGHLETPVTNTDPHFRHSRTPVLSSCRNQGPRSYPSWHPVWDCRFQKKLYVKKRWSPRWELPVGAPVREPQGQPSAERTQWSQRWAQNKAVKFSLLLPTAVLLSGSKETEPGARKRLHQASPVQRAGKLGLLNAVTYPCVFYSAIRCVYG